MAQTAVILKVAYLHRKRTWRRIAILGRPTAGFVLLSLPLLLKCSCGAN